MRIIYAAETGGASGAINYKGTWNAETNVPVLSSGVGAQGDYYVVSVAGATTLDGISDWKVTDWAVFNGTVWEKVDNTNEEMVPRSEWGVNGIGSILDNTLSWTDSSPDYTLSIQPTSGTFDYWVSGIKYTTSGDTVQIDNTKEGIHAIYYDGAVLTSFANPTVNDIRIFILTKALVCILYWDVSEAEAIYVGDERHGKNMSSSTHLYNHFINGLEYLYGLGLNNIAVDGSGATSDAQFGIDSGAVSDEDLYTSIDAIASTTGLPIYYMLGAQAEWQKFTESGFSVRTVDGTSATRLAYNEYSLGTWSLSDVGDSDYVLGHIFATTEKDNPMIAILGQNKYATVKLAREGALTEISELILNDVLFPEIRPIATIIFQTKLSYANSVNARVVSTDEGDSYIDWRNESISRTKIATSDHGLLTGLGNDDHPQYALKQYLEDNYFIYNSEDLSSQIDGVTSVFQLDYEYILNTTRGYQQYIALQRGVSGDPSYGNDYYEVETSGVYGRSVVFYAPPSNGEWLQFDYMRHI